MKNLVYVAAVLATSFTMSTASAKNVWRECGIGGMIFTDIGWAAIISNVIWDLGTTATSSNVSSDDMCEGKSASAASFIHETYATIEEETAIGSGQHLVTMLNILGCDSQAHANIIEAVRGDMQSSMTSSDYAAKSRLEKAESYHTSLMNNVEHRFASECQAI